MSRLRDRVAIVTGAGRGLGRSYALRLAREGAKVVVNDLGGGLHGERGDGTPADDVVREIREAGGQAIANGDDVADWEGAHRLVQAALDAFGDVDVLINNAGILRDRMLVNMTEQEWDDVVRVHLRGHFCPTRAVAAHWRARAKENPGPRDAVLIHTTSISGLFGSPGQANYASAKSGIATFAYECHLELNERLGVRSYAIGPSARTRLTESSPAAVEAVAKPEAGFDFFDPDNVSPFVVWLASAGCGAPSGTVYTVEGDEVTVVQPWTRGPRIKAGDSRWTLEQLDQAWPELFGQAGAHA
ncbi:putative short-chain dehydrogenase/reductase [Acrocarpospora pleiomorpha]|uniref:Putative short-chain dehydrogenase/reductase n=1 Tax=Acrocarpospora pleiomorpha TaxID=90975 RepID=A0A5M3XIN1_9ACTN|nr:SDR family NAD(P)-dependent oxidoreductase [Acrocarpospora pleiomorpha]GES19541.1 putative short-chain dehydrogenase/reductase [Acrocarpospora pleiomorpha]